MFDFHMAAMMTIWQPQSSVVPKRGIPGVRSKYVRDDTKSVLVLVNIEHKTFIVILNSIIGLVQVLCVIYTVRSTK